MNEASHIRLSHSYFQTSFLWPPRTSVTSTRPIRDYGEWLSHLMSLKDGHYARHPRVLYYARNLLQRKRAAQTGRVFLRRDEEARGMSAEELQELLAGGNSSIPNQLHRFARGL